MYVTLLSALESYLYIVQLGNEKALRYIQPVRLHAVSLTELLAGGSCN